MRHLPEFLFIIILLFLHCNKDLSPVSKIGQDANLQEMVWGGTTQNPGEFEITNTSDSDLFIPYVHYPYCNFFLYSIQEEKSRSWKNLFFRGDDSLWTSDSHLDSILVVCEMYLSPLKLKPNQTYKGKIEGRVLNSGHYKLVIRYSFQEQAKPEEYKQVETIFTVSEP